MSHLQIWNGAQDRLGRFSSKTIPFAAESGAISDRQTENDVIEFIHYITARMAAAPTMLNEVLPEIVQFLGNMVLCDSCFVYLVDGSSWVLKCWKGSSAEELDESKLYMGDPLLKLLIKYRMPVTISDDGPEDPELICLDDLEDRPGEMLVVVPVLSRSEVLGTINIQHRTPHAYSEHEMKMLSTIGFLLGSEIMRTQLEAENARLIDRLETRKLLERGKGILQREFGITEEQAYLALQRQSRQKRRPIKEIAEAIILRDQLRTQDAQ